MNEVLTVSRLIEEYGYQRQFKAHEVVLRKPAQHPDATIGKVVCNLATKANLAKQRTCVAGNNQAFSASSGQ